MKPNWKLKIVNCKFAIVAVLALSALFCGQSLQAQATTQVIPRTYPVFSSVLLTNLQSLPASGAILTNTATPTVAAQTNTFIPFSGAHAIGLTCSIVNSNNFAAASNLVVYIYPAYDTLGGNPNSLNGRYGTNFSTVPLLTWTIAYLTNTIVSTNIPAAIWEPATSLGYTITNTTKSNIVVTLTQYVAP
jgi:hypothetical protein